MKIQEIKKGDVLTYTSESPSVVTGSAKHNVSVVGFDRMAIEVETANAYRFWCNAWELSKTVEAA